MGVIENKMRSDLGLRGMRPNTVKTYVRCCRRFVKHYGRSPLDLTSSDVRAYLEHLRLTERKAPRSINVYAAALAFLFGETLDRRQELGRIPRLRVRPKVPVVLSPPEVEKVLNALTTPLQRAVCMTMYGAGLRVSEACALAIDDIDSQRMQLRVRDGKGGRDRYIPLSPRLLSELRSYYRKCRPRGALLFPGRRKGKPLAREALNKALRIASQKAGVKHVSPHTLRHCFATSLLELGADLRMVQLLLGHCTVRSTVVYLHISQARLAKVKLPIDTLGPSPDAG